MKKMFLAVFALIILVQPLRANELQDARNVVKNSVESIVNLIENKDLDEEVRRDKVMSLIKEVFDFNLMAKLALGKTNWNKFNPNEREEFVLLFSKELENTYYGKTEFFSGEKIIYEDPTKIGTKVKIPTSVMIKEDKLEVSYKLYKTKNNRWRIYDATIQGVSMVSSFRSQYNQFLSKNSVAVFLEELKNKTSKPKS